MTMPYSSAAWMTSGSPMLPPGWTMYCTPRLDAWSRLSRKGKKASDDKATPWRVESHSSFSTCVSGSGITSNCCSHLLRSTGVKSPSMKRTRAFTLSWRFVPGLNCKLCTFGCCRKNQVSALRPASLMQSTLLCCPAPTPITCPFFAYATLFDWVYLIATEATTRSVTAEEGTCWICVAMVFRCSSGVNCTSFRLWQNPAPMTSRYSMLGSAAPSTASRRMNLPPFFARRISNASGV
mmetsp:Transcript_22634/g.52743  ORF Transcript_22634/g.52743 Transcript_22634/m.52743 type:complete len:237 (+) Transcript_22634:150-860(+)